MAARKTPPHTTAALPPSVAIRRLEARIAELRRIDEGKVSYDDPIIEPLEKRISADIRECFGTDSPEAAEYRWFEIESGPKHVGMKPHHHVQNFERGLPKAIASLEALRARLLEQIEETGGNIAATEVFRGLRLHPAIRDAAGRLFEDGHYAQAVLEGSKALIKLVQQASGRSDLDGAELMELVFSQKEPILSFIEDGTSHREEQRGMMFLYTGAMKAVRNPRAHKFVTDTDDRGLETLAMLSLLAKWLDDARKR